MSKTKTCISSDLKSAYEEQKRRPSEELGFYLISSNRELLLHMEAVLNKYGVFGVMDSCGRVHYLLDARKGAPYAEKQLFQTVTSLLAERNEDNFKAQMQTQNLVATVLQRYAFNQNLRGYQILFVMLEMSLRDYSLLNPISKRLYPQTAKVFSITAAQVERNVRYLFENLANKEDELRDQVAARLEVNEKEDIKQSFLSGYGERLPVAKTVVRLWEICRREAQA